MKALEIDQKKYNQIKKYKSIIFYPIAYKNKYNTNKYPLNIYKILSAEQMKALEPEYDEFTISIIKEINCFHKIILKVNSLYYNCKVEKSIELYNCIKVPITSIELDSVLNETEKVHKKESNINLNKKSLSRKKLRNKNIKPYRSQRSYKKKIEGKNIISIKYSTKRELEDVLQSNVLILPIDKRLKYEYILEIIKSSISPIEIGLACGSKIHTRFCKYDKKSKEFMLKEDEDGFFNVQKKIINFKTSDFFNLYDEYFPVTHFQIISSRNNHATRKHSIKDETITIIYKDKKGDEYKTAKLLMHYCQQCKVYFDFRESFFRQLEELDINCKQILASIVSDDGTPFKFDESLFSKESLLHSLGYVVGNTYGIDAHARQEIIKNAILRNILTITDIKNILEFNIQFAGKRKSNKYSCECWENDLDFINSYYKLR